MVANRPLLSEQPDLRHKEQNMEFQFRPKINNQLYIRDPYQTVLGKKIVVQSIHLIYKNGFKGFTFKKLAAGIGTTEAGIYRYFKNKDRLLVYIACWYWSWLEYQIVFETKNIKDPRIKLKKILGLLSVSVEDRSTSENINTNYLQQIIIEEGFNTCCKNPDAPTGGNPFIQPYRDLCLKVENCILEYHPVYKYPRSLATTLIETAHLQKFIIRNVLLLSDFEKPEDQTNISLYLEDLLFGNLNR